MYTIHSYTDTRCELEISKRRLNMLTDKKTALYCKYFPITPALKEVMVAGGGRNKDKMADYVHELNEVDIGTGKSLAEEIVYQQNRVNKLQDCLSDMTNSLSQMRGTEYKLYYEIVVNGVSISKAVDNIAVMFEKEPRTIWKNYYCNIKKDINKIKRYHNSTLPTRNVCEYVEKR